jgi:hypothetical protein
MGKASADALATGGRPSLLSTDTAGTAALNLDRRIFIFRLC